MPSIWEKEHKLKRWVKKNQKKLFDFNFDFDLMDIKSDPLLYYLSKNLNIENNYIYTSAGISQLINSILTLPRWTNIYIIKNEFALYERTLDIYEKKKKIINEGNFESLIKFFKNYKSLDTDLFCFSSPRWYNGVNITIKELEELQYYFKGNIIIDEAYFDYSNNLNGFINYCLENDNIILFRSFSCQG
ncbi:MAG: hypothetical protein RSE21_01455 [Bacilli bacterium]